jgi:hypothetical protein
VAGNLNANGKLYPNGGQATINQTLMLPYPNGERETNHYIVQTNSPNHTENTEIFFDKQKGVAVNAYYLSKDTFGSETETFTETITNTNTSTWAVPEFTAFVVLVVMAVASVLMIAAKKKLVPNPS